MSYPITTKKTTKYRIPHPKDLDSPLTGVLEQLDPDQPTHGRKVALVRVLSMYKSRDPNSCICIVTPWNCRASVEYPLFYILLISMLQTQGLSVSQTASYALAYRLISLRLPVCSC